MSKKTISKYGLLAVVIIALIALPGYGSGNMMTVATLILIYLAMGQMWNLMGGYAGLLSLGMQTFIGLGGYALAVLSVKYGLNIYLSILLGAVVAVVFALVISPALFKMSGVYFAIGSWVVAEALVIWFSNWELVDYAKGIAISSVYRISATQIYYTALILGVAAVAIVFFLMRSRTGLALMAIRDNESAAETMGVKVFRTKLKVYLIASFFMTIAGGVMYIQQSFINPSEGFGINWTIIMTFMVIIGGMGTMDGPILGAVFYVLLYQYLYTLPGMSMIILGAVAVIVIIIAPKGIMGTINEKTGFEILSPRRSLK